MGNGDWLYGVRPGAGLEVGYGEGELSANLCSASGRMIRGDRGPGESVDEIELIRSTRVNVGELVRDAHATFVSLCKIGPAILFNVISPGARPKRGNKRALPGVPVKFSTLVHPKYQINVGASPVRLVEDNFIVPLGSPITLLNAEIQVVLSGSRYESRTSNG